MEKYFFLKRDALRPTEEQRLLTKPFYQNANTVYARFDEWKDIDKFYFIPLYLEMTYCINGIVAEMAPDPVWLEGIRTGIRLAHQSYRSAGPDRR